MQRSSQESEHLKATSRINKHQEAQQIFKCQCGKNYLTFSALYLHANLKHGLRLTTRRTQGNHKIERRDNKTIITYLLKESQNISQNQYNNQKKFQKDPAKISDKSKFYTKIDIINEYLDTLKNNSEFQTIQFDIHYSVMESLIEYFSALNKLKASEQDAQQEEADITYYFNDFCTYYMPLVRKSPKTPFQVQPIVNSLNIFYKWLKQSQYTEVNLLCHDAYTRKTGSKQRQ